MPPTVTLRTFDWPDYEAVVALWQAVGLRLTVSDSRAALAATLDHAADLFVVADAGGQIIGAVLGTFDGRRGWLRHLAVASAWAAASWPKWSPPADTRMRQDQPARRVRQRGGRGLLRPDRIHAPRACLNGEMALSPFRRK